MKYLDSFNQYSRNEWVASKACKIPKGSFVLDVGAGAGPYRSLFSHCVYKTQDFGKAPSLIGKYTILDYESEITSIPVSDESFDVILCTEVIEHIPEPFLAIKEMARILKNNGMLLLTAPLGSFIHQKPYHFYSGFTPYWYKEFLPKAGFEIISIESNRGFFSLFGQEAIRFSTFLDPRRTIHTKIYWPLLTFLWIITLPILRFLFPILGKFLDKLYLENDATVGYHIVAIKKSNH